MKVGDVIWIFRENRRVYTKPASGREWGMLIWREHWEPNVIESETSRSWVLKRGTKISKKGPWHGVAFSEQEVDELSWREENRIAISDAVRAADYKLLKQIADLIGYKPK